MDNLYDQKIVSTQTVFDNRYLDDRTLYLHYFKTLPSMNYIGNVDGEKMFEELKAMDNVKQVHSYRWFDHKKKGFEFDRTIVVFDNNCLIELQTNYCMILHDDMHDDFVTRLIAIAKKYKERQRRQPLEINLIVNGSNGMELKAMEIRRTKLDVALFYEDDFIPIDKTIRARLNKKNDKGIILLHGLPGTGKTTYLRYLIGKMKKRILFLSPGIAGNLMSPGFIDLLIDNPETVLIIEDAENIIMDRRTSGDSSVSNLLNISDGLMADFLNVQLICTFNSALTMVDSALMRKGRLIAKYEFGKLSVDKAQRLSDHLGFNTIINKPMTVAEIANQHEQNFETKQVQVIGFRREAESLSHDLTELN